MGQAPPPRCESSCACENASTEATWEPTYPPPFSYVKPSELEAFDDWEPLEPSCHCGREDDDADDEFQVGPVYPELGSYVQRRPALRAEAEPAGGCMERSDSLPDLIPLLPGMMSSSSTSASRASMYMPCSSDELDLQVKRNLSKLEEHACRELSIHRKRPGEYTIDGRLVCIYWRGQRGTFGKGPQELYVHEAVAGTSDRDDVPLSIYLEQVAHVVLSTMPGANIAANMTFLETGTDLARVRRGSCTYAERNRAMFMACSQAKLRSGVVQEQFGSSGVPVIL